MGPGGPRSGAGAAEELARSGPSTGLDLVRKRPHLKTNIGPRHYRDPCQYYGKSFLIRSTLRGKSVLNLLLVRHSRT